MISAPAAYSPPAPERWARTFRALKLAEAEIDAARWALEALSRLPPEVVLHDGQERIVRACIISAIDKLEAAK